MPANVNGSKWIWPVTRLAIYLRDHFHCVYCNRDLHGAKPRDVTLDHLVPRSQGGTNAPTNLVTACLACNVAKGDTPWRQYVRSVVAAELHQFEVSYRERVVREHARFINNRRRRVINRELAKQLRISDNVFIEQQQVSPRTGPASDFPPVPSPNPFVDLDWALNPYIRSE